MIEPSVDELMWLIADEGDHHAVEAFVKRHPELSSELSKRVNMVRAMKGSKGPVESAPEIPQFTPRLVGDLPRAKRFPVWAIAALGMVAVAFGSYTATTRFLAPKTEPAEISVHAPTNEPADHKIVSGDPNLPPGFDPNQNVVPPTPKPQQPEPRWMKPVVLQEQDTTLFAVFNQIESETGLRITVTPGLDNARIAAIYPSWKAIDVLRDLGRRLGFTAFEQGDDEVLVIPAVASENQGTPTVKPSPNTGTPPSEVGSTEAELPKIDNP